MLVDIGDDDSNLDFFGSSELFANYVTFLGDCLEKAGRIAGCPLDCVSVPLPGLHRITNDFAQVVIARARDACFRASVHPFGDAPFAECWCKRTQVSNDTG